MQVMHGINLRRGRVRPRRTKQAEPAFHLSEYPARLFAQTIGAHIAKPDDFLTIACVTFLRLAAAGDDDAI